jgi:hypothetical protein
MLERLKSELEEASFMLARNADRQDVHRKLLSAMLIVEQLQQQNGFSSVDKAEAGEAEKVARRLNMWAKPDRQSQYNARILNAFLSLSRNGKNPITEEELNRELGSNTWFWPNFNQMKTISERNHGKVFDVVGGAVSIWLPVEPAVKAYEERTRSGCR